MSATDRPFFDTNVLVYLLSDDAHKADRAETLLSGGGIVSVQVLNEFAAVSRRKLRLAWPEIREILATIRAVTRVEPLTLAMHEAGLELCARYDFALYDSMIVAAALQAHCTLLYSEDMQDGHVIETLTIRNPFREA
ncbi:MAG: PIN domain-containing protein [Methylovirgula sp.]|uniref:PIN domain-containing protein n=1 Tax=Methylovirgula sp. TaxID=1978224 RepID=UPI00307660AF